MITYKWYSLQYEMSVRSPATRDVWAICMMSGQRNVAVYKWMPRWKLKWPLVSLNSWGIWEVKDNSHWPVTEKKCGEKRQKKKKWRYPGKMPGPKDSFCEMGLEKWWNWQAPAGSGRVRLRKSYSSWQSLVPCGLKRDCFTRYISPRGAAISSSAL